jgi:hypothetical protein
MKYMILETDFIQAQWIHVKPRRVYAIAGIIIILLNLIVMVGSGIQYFSGSYDGKLFFLLLCLLFYFSALILWRRYKIKKVYRQQKSLQREVNVEINERGVVFSTENGNYRLDFVDVHKYKDSSSVLLLYHSDMMFNIIPKKSQELRGLSSEIVSKLIELKKSNQ